MARSMLRTRSLRRRSQIFNNLRSLDDGASLAAERAAEGMLEQGPEDVSKESSETENSLEFTQIP